MRVVLMKTNPEIEGSKIMKYELKEKVTMTEGGEEKEVIVHQAVKQIAIGTGEEIEAAVQGIDRVIKIDLVIKTDDQTMQVEMIVTQTDIKGLKYLDLDLRTVGLDEPGPGKES